MLVDAIVAWLHFLGIFVLVGSLSGELMSFRREMTQAAQKTLRVLDLHYGAAAGIVLITGLLRVFWYGKGAAYYAANPFFWALIALFAAIGLLSLPPTLYYMRWRRSTGPVTVAEFDYRRIRRMLWLEAAGLVLAPLTATLMARGAGL
jgi:putative membrane protein